MKSPIWGTEIVSYTRVTRSGRSAARGLGFQQILYAITPRARLVMTNNVPVETNTNTFAGTHDNSEATKDACTTPQGSGTLTYRVDYNVDAVTLPTVRSVTARIFAWFTGTTSPGTVRPVFNATLVGTAQALTNQHQWFEFLFPSDPLGGAWTPATVSNRKWGFNLTVDDATDPSGVGLHCSELEWVVRSI